MIKNKIVPVPFPFDDLSGRKLRPAVCLSERISPYNHVLDIAETMPKSYL